MPYTFKPSRAQEECLEQLRCALGVTTKEDVIAKAISFLACIHNIAKDNPKLVCEMAQMIGAETDVLPTESTH